MLDQLRKGGPVSALDSITIIGIAIGIGIENPYVQIPVRFDSDPDPDPDKIDYGTIKFCQSPGKAGGFLKRINQSSSHHVSLCRS